MTKEELVEFLKENLTITIDRHVQYYSYPSLDVEIRLGDELITYSSCTIYDGDNS